MSKNKITREVIHFRSAQDLYHDFKYIFDLFTIYSRPLIMGESGCHQFPLRFPLAVSFFLYL
jgi:hypothetical protein